MKLRYKDGSTIDELELLLKRSTCIENLVRCGKGELLQRYFEFEVRGQKYEIIWFINQMTLFIGEFELLFDEVNLESTFPRRFKNFLQFYDKGKLIAVLPLEEYDSL